MNTNLKLPFVLFFHLVILLQYNSLNSQNNLIETTGDVLISFLPASALTYTLIEKDKEGMLQFGKGYLLNDISTRLIKGLIKKERPDKSNFNSFPSGHTSIAFQSASFIQKRYGWKFGIPAYALAGFVGYSRIQAKKHDIVDVLAGMVLGIGSTYLFTTPYQKKHMKLSFSSQQNNYMLGFTYTF
jgi:membrane-associated phospholipid phosphatase